MQPETVSHYDKEFTKVGYASQTLRNREFESCVFKECDFSYSDLNTNVFTDCTFRACRFVLTKVADTVLKNVVFEECQLAGVDFGQCAVFGFGVRFTACSLDNCSFYGRKMAKTSFAKSKMRACFFSECDLHGADFDNCTLAETEFHRCNLSGADFRTAAEFCISPENNTIKKAKFSNYNLSGLLTTYDLVIE